MRTMLSALGFLFIAMWAITATGIINFSDLLNITTNYTTNFSFSSIAKFNPLESINQAHVMVVLFAAALFHG